MPTVRRTPRAVDDLGRIVDFIAKHNLSAALAWLVTVEAVFELLAKQPEMGQLRQTKRLKKSRRHTHGNYSIYYRPLADGIEILRVLHGARNEERLV